MIKYPSSCHAWQKLLVSPTNHSARRTMSVCAHNFSRRVFHLPMIAQLSRHISNYATAYLKQQRDMCQILQGSGRSSTNAIESHACTDITNSHYRVHRSLSVSHTADNYMQRATQTSSASLGSSSGLFSRAVFNGSVTININNHGQL